MAEYGWPTPDPENDNKRVVTDANHEQMAFLNRSGVIAGPSADAPMYADGTGLQVKLRPNLNAVVRGAGWRTDGDGLTVPISENTSGQTRIDLGVIRLDRTDRTVSVVIIEGTPGAGVAPARTASGDVYGTDPWDLPLAEITVPDSASTILASQVNDVAWRLGSDGQIRCYTAYRPPHESGRLIWETDRGRGLASSGVAWMIDRENTSWQNFSPISGKWTALECAGRRVNGFVSLRVRVSRIGHLSANSQDDVATLPASLRPDVIRYINGTIVTGSGIARVSISTNGVIRVLQHDLAIGNTGFLELVDTYPALLT